ncbi:MAG: nucleotidyltransferase domain-containing protein [Sedimentisphaerales bacterium]|nr:nucleotidyltransferase domain-containing protein [Sedimentisphaerales bacterium]
MVAMIERKRAELVELCRRYRVEKLYLFGSAASDRPDVECNDLDFLVCFAGRAPTGEYADRYLGFADDLERLFGRPVDLVTVQSIRNPYFQREVESTRRLIYERPHEETAA